MVQSKITTSINRAQMQEINVWSHVHPHPQQNTSTWLRLMSTFPQHTRSAISLRNTQSGAGAIGRLNATEDKVNPLSSRGDMKVTKHLDIPALYTQGMEQAKAVIFACGLLDASSPDLDFHHLAAKGFSLRCPHGE